MTIRDDARQEAERRWPSPNTGLYEGLIIGFEKGAVWASEQADQEEDQGPAAGCAYCVGAGGYEDYDGSWTECSCQRADREPSDAELFHAANVYMGYEPPYKALDEFSPEFLADIRAALLAAQEVRRG